MANDPNTDILSADFATAQQALTDAVKNRDAALVARALNQRHLELRLKAATELAVIGDRASVPHLVEALERNQVKYTGGAETTILQVDLNRALITALEKLTGGDLGPVDPGSRQDIDRVLRSARDWLGRNKD